MQKRHAPGCPCCEESPCLIAKDSLQGKVLSDTWTLESGSWDEIAVVDTYAQSTGVVELWHVTPHPDSPYPSDVRLRVRGAAGSILRIIFSANGGYGYEATQDALIVELTPGADCGTLKLYQRKDGVEDLLATLPVYGAVVDEWHDMRGCYDPETEVLTGSILPHDGTYWSQLSADVEAHTDGAYAGFASGTDDQSDFDTFVYRKLWYDKLITPLCTDLSITEIATRISIDGFSPPTTNIANLSILFYLENVNVGTFPYIIYSASTDAATFQSDMNTWLSANLPPVTCTVTGTVASGFLIAFSDTTNQYNRARALMNRADPLPTETLEDAWVNDDVRIIVTTEGQKLFRLSYNGEQTADLSTDATAGEIQTALEGLSTIGAGNVSVSGVAGDWQVEWTGTLLGTDVFPIVAITSIGDCLGEGYYYSETERVTCSTCRDCTITVDPVKYAAGDLPCTYTTTSGTWAVDADGHINGIGDLARVEEATEAKYVAYFYCNEIYSGTTIEMFGVTLTFTKLEPDPGEDDNQWQVDLTGSVTDTLTGTFAEIGDGKAYLSLKACRHASSTILEVLTFGTYLSDPTFTEYQWATGFTPPESTSVVVGIHAVHNASISLWRHAYYGGIHCPSCRVCQTCDVDHMPNEVLTVKLGTWNLTAAASITLTFPDYGSWTGAPLCDWCPNVNGDWLVINENLSSCEWIGGQADVCYVKCFTTGHVVCAQTVMGDFGLVLQLVGGGVGGTVRWELLVDCWAFYGVDPTGWPAMETGGYACYASDWFPPDECDTFPRTLTLSDECSFGFVIPPAGYSLVGCAGTPPSTVVIDNS